MSTADVLACLHGLIGLLAALTASRATGTGQHVDMAMLHAMCFTDDWTSFTLDDFVQDRSAAGVWSTGGGPFLIAGHLALVWKALSGTHGLQDGLPSDAALDDKIRARRRSIQKFLEGLPDRLAVIDALERADLVWGEVRDGEAVYAAPGLRDRNAVRAIDDRTGGLRRIIDSPYRFSDAESGVSGVARHLGEDNADVLSDWLGLEGVDVARLTNEGVLVAGQSDP